MIKRLLVPVLSTCRLADYCLVYRHKRWVLQWRKTQSYQSLHLSAICERANGSIDRPKSVRRVSDWCFG